MVRDNLIRKQIINVRNSDTKEKYAWLVFIICPCWDGPMNKLSPALSGLKLVLQMNMQNQTERHFSNILSQNKISSAGGVEEVAQLFPYT